MNDPRAIDGVLVQWGDRLFYNANRRVPAGPGGPRSGSGLRDCAAAIRQRIESTAVGRAPQVMVKVTGGGRGMAAIAAHLRYISKNGRLPMEDDRGLQREGTESVQDVAEQWRYGGSRIPERSDRREAFNIMLSMPRGTDPLTVQRAAREFAIAELEGHRYVMVLHDHQANPHVHLSVRAESTLGKRLNPRKADLQRWRERFAERLRSQGIDAEATRQATRGVQRNHPTLWRTKAAADERLREPRGPKKSGERFHANRMKSIEAWLRIAQALEKSDEPADRKLAQAVIGYVRRMPFAIEFAKRRQAALQRELPGMPAPQRMVEPERSRSGPEIER
ncbi:MAG: conjugal transfer protein TraS [Burkholderiaceae bacterium]